MHEERSDRMRDNEKLCEFIQMMNLISEDIYQCGERLKFVRHFMSCLVMSI